MASDREVDQPNNERESWWKEGLTFEKTNKIRSDPSSTLDTDDRDSTVESSFEIWIMKRRADLHGRSMILDRYQHSTDPVVGEARIEVG